MKKLLAIITVLALTACNGINVVSMSQNNYTSSKVGDKVIYTRPDGSQFTFNFLGLPYEIAIENGQLVDKTDYSKYPTRIKKDKNDYDIRIIERDGVIYYE